MSSPAEGSKPAEGDRLLQRTESVVKELEMTLDRTVALARQLYEQRTGRSWKDLIESDLPR